MEDKMKAAVVFAICILVAVGVFTLADHRFGNGIIPEKVQAGEAIQAEETPDEEKPAGEMPDGQAANEEMPAEELTNETGETNEYGNTPEDEAEIEMILFRNTASVAKMEITTGLTTEYLDPLLLYPVRVVRQGEEVIIKDYNDLEKMGLEALYTPELLKAIEASDPESVEIRDWRAVMGDPEGAYIVLERDENGLSGIREFHYSK